MRSSIATPTIVIPGWCYCGGRFHWFFGFEGWVTICDHCSARSLQEAAMLIAERKVTAKSETLAKLSVGGNGNGASTNGNSQAHPAYQRSEGSGS